MKHYKSVELLSNFRLSSPPWTNVKLPYWKLSGDGSGTTSKRKHWLVWR